MNTDTETEEAYMNTEKTGDPQTYAIIGAAIEVHWHLGHGFLEAVYQEALEIELSARGIPWKRDVKLGITYKGQPLKHTYKADLLCYDAVLLELKALAHLTSVEDAQLINY